MNNDTQIYVAFHREGPLLPDDPVYKGLHVGKEHSKLQLDMFNDATGENISGKNEVYSELTGWYWIWKNQKHAIVGTAHYRRYLTAYPTPLIRQLSKSLLFLAGLKKKRHGLFYIKNADQWRDRILSKEEIKAVLGEYDAILPQKKRFKYTVNEQYLRRHKEEDIVLTRTIIAEKYPDFLKAFDEVFQQKEMYSFNMFVMPWLLFDEYMDWLFTILFELEKRSNIDWNDKYQKRVCAFMAERLQTVWFHKKQLKVKELPVLYFKKMKVAHF